MHQTQLVELYISVMKGSELCVGRLLSREKETKFLSSFLKHGIHGV
jgi:hypothetical protein